MASPLYAGEIFVCKGDTRMEEKEKVVLEAMKNAGKPVRPGDVAKSLDLESKEVSKIIDSLKKKGMVVSPKRCYYAPSDS
jgi:Mn-dependent DtxR family transcriptional regulator